MVNRDASHSCPEIEAELRWLFFTAEQSELRQIARGLGEAEMAERMRGQQPPARGPLQLAALNQNRLDDVFDGVARLGKRRRHGLYAHRTAAVIHRDGREITTVHGIQAGGTDLQRR